MSCFTECKEIKVFDLNSNTTLDIEDCTCKGCCYTIQMLIYLIYVGFFFMMSLLFCEISAHKRKYYQQRSGIILNNNNDPVPQYTENV